MGRGTARPVAKASAMPSAAGESARFREGSTVGTVTSPPRTPRHRSGTYEAEPRLRLGSGKDASVSRSWGARPACRGQPSWRGRRGTHASRGSGCTNCTASCRHDPERATPAQVAGRRTHRPAPRGAANTRYSMLFKVESWPVEPRSTPTTWMAAAPPIDPRIALPPNAIMPPSTTSASPVTKRASSLAR